MTETTFEDIDTGFTAMESPPDIGATKPTAKRRGRPPGSGRGRKRSLESEIGGYLSLLNMAFAFAPDPFRGDMLDQMEIEALAKALNEYAQQNATVYKYLSTVLVQGGALGNLAIVAIVILGRRLARHGIIPGEMDERLTVMMQMMT